MVSSSTSFAVPTEPITSARPLIHQPASKHTIPGAVHASPRVAGRPNQRYPLLFRDYLRAHPGAAEAYALIKQQLCATLNGNIDAYIAIKDPICDLIYQAAEAWAVSVNWSPGPSDA